MPHQLRAGRVARAPEPPAEAPDQTDGVAEARGWRQRARAGEGGEHAQLAIREQQFARQFRHLAPELDHQLDPPPHDHLDGNGSFEPLGRVVLQLLDLAAGLEDPEVLFDAPAQGVPAQDTAWRRRCWSRAAWSARTTPAAWPWAADVPRAHGRPTARPPRPRGRAASPAGSAVSRRRRAPPGCPCGPVYWPSPARSAAAPRPCRRRRGARCAPCRTDGARPSARRASSPCPARTLPAATPIVEIERFTNVIGDLPEAANAL